MGLDIAERRSRPDPATDSSASLPHAGIRRALAHMRVHCHRRLPLAEVASIARMSQFHFSRVFHRTVGVTFREHLVALRLRNADEMIERDPWAPLIRVAARAGFGTLRNLQDHYRRRYGYPPSQRRASVQRDATRWGGEQDPSPRERDSARTPHLWVSGSARNRTAVSYGQDRHTVIPSRAG
jgi:transcriptional regulator GlxA family with amidase domain